MSEQPANEIHPLSRYANLLRIVGGGLSYLVSPETRNGRSTYEAYAEEIDRIAARLDEIGNALGATL